MRTSTQLTLNLAAAGLLATAMACGGGSSSSTPTADITGTLAPVSGASIHTSALSTGVNVVAVDENGNNADSATGVTGAFTLTVPTGHDYVLIVSDDTGIISAIVYDATSVTPSELAVDSGTASIDLGAITVDAASRSVEVDDPASVTEDANDGTQTTGVPEPAESKMKSDTNGDGTPDAVVDTDGDHIPDAVDTDKDNDGIENSKDKKLDGTDLSTDFNNDGTPDATSDDIDGDGIPNSEDKNATTGKDESRDSNNDGVDDDREAGSSNNAGSGDVTSGETLYTANCAGCHGADAMGAAGSNNKSVVGEGASDIEEAIGEVTEMSSLSTLTVTEVEDIAAYLQSLGSGSEGSEGSGDTETGTTTDTGTTTGGSGSGTGTTTGGGSGSGGTTTTTGDAAAGASIYTATTSCILCHGANGTQIAGKSVVGKSASQISAAISSVGAMSGFSTLTAQDLADLEAYLATL